MDIEKINQTGYCRCKGNKIVLGYPTNTDGTCRKCLKYHLPSLVEGLAFDHALVRKCMLLYRDGVFDYEEMLQALVVNLAWQNEKLINQLIEAGPSVLIVKEQEQNG